MATTNKTLNDMALDLGTTAANVYRDEFGEDPTREKAGDWDAIAWGEDSRKLEREGASPDDLEDLWPVYVAAFYGD